MNCFRIDGRDCRRKLSGVDHKFETLNPVLARQRSKLALSKQALADL
jgi:hypothetical protein